MFNLKRPFYYQQEWEETGEAPCERVRIWRAKPMENPQSSPAAPSTYSDEWES